MDTTQLLNDENRRTQTILSELKALQSELSVDQLNWKPTNKKWSVLECIEHINTACRHYIPEIRKQMKKASKGNSSTRFRPGLLGNYLANMMQPQPDGQIKGKMKTLSKFRPDHSSLDRDAVFQECIQHHMDLVSFIEQSSQVNINAVRVVSAIGPFIKFKLGDCFRFNTAHHLRHLLQARNVIKATGFPAH